MGNLRTATDKIFEMIGNWPSWGRQALVVAGILVVLLLLGSFLAHWA